MNTLASTVELRPLLLELAEEYCRETPEFVLDLARKGEGREIIGSVAGRTKTEDRYVGIDKIMEDRFWGKCKEYRGKGLRIRVISEHFPEGYGDDNPNVVCDLDPFDGSDQYRKGIREAWYSVFSFTTVDDQDLAGGCVDILNGIMDIADPMKKEVRRTYLATRSSPEVTSVVSPVAATELSDDAVVASYKGKWEYLRIWFLVLFGFFGQSRFAGITHYPWGGSSIYALIAAGVVWLYIMVNEPTNEIRPGRSFVAATDLYVSSVVEGGILRYIRWSQKRRVPFFIAAANEQLARSVVGGIWSTRDEDQDRRGFTARVKRKVSNAFSRPRIGRLFLVSR